MEAPAARIVKGLYVLGMAVFFLLQATVSIKTYLAREVVSPSFKNNNRRKKCQHVIFRSFQIVEDITVEPRLNTTLPSFSVCPFPYYYKRLRGGTLGSIDDLCPEGAEVGPACVEEAL